MLKILVLMRNMRTGRIEEAYVASASGTQDTARLAREVSEFNRGRTGPGGITEKAFDTLVAKLLMSDPGKEVSTVPSWLAAVTVEELENQSLPGWRVHRYFYFDR